MLSNRPLQSPILVGRDDVLALFEPTVREAAAGRGTTVLIAGEAGIGKSRVVGALVRQAAQAGFLYAKGNLSPQDQLVPLASINDLARSMEPEDFGTLRDDILAIQGGKGGDSLASRRILVHEVAERLASAIDRPTVLAFEDLHWADELSLEVIADLARLAGVHPLLVVANYRPEELPSGSIHREWRARLLTQRHATEVVLDRLSAEQTAQMATLILASGLPAPREV